ncbi:MAG: penicillin-binding protein 2 [Clostridia bacterium]|nr:penicillin-binding protein 2 [Clostridia bacterium]
MKKRAFAIMMSLILLFSATGIRMASLARSTQQAGVTASTMSIDIKTLRGTIYDCNLKPLTNSETELYAAAKPSGYALGQLKGKVMPDVFESVLKRMAAGKPVAVKIDSHIVPSSDIKEFEVAQRYASDSLACHIIGYLDGSGDGVSGIEESFDSLLSEGESTVRVRFSSDANGRVMIGEEISVEGEKVPPEGVVLTIDKDIQMITEKALDGSGAECAAAVVIEIESGAIRACASRPLFDGDNIAASLNDEKSPLINRALLPFSVGSVFKPVVAAAALEGGVSENFEYNCTGSVTHNGVTFNCHKEDGHGVLNMEGALTYSCNTYFIALAIETGAYKIIETAEKFGFGRETVLSDKHISSPGFLPDSNKLDSNAAIANISFGQGALTATPVQICNAMASIARGGIYIEPYLIEGKTNESGELIKIKRYEEKLQIISNKHAAMLQNYLKKVVEEGSGSRAQSEYVTSAGKTATAQTGKSKGGEEIYNAWFAGYFPADNPKYAVVIMKEDGGEGALSCAPVFKIIAEECVRIDK